MIFLTGYFPFEMQFMQWLYEIGNQFLDIFFWTISQVGGTIAIVVFMCITYWIIDKTKGKKITYAITLSMTFNNLLKMFFSAKRPFEYENYDHLRKLKDSKLSDSASGTSFPSGHSQNAGSSFLSLILYLKKKWLTVLSIILIILVPLSRLYLGVHFPRDVVVGLTIGLLTAFLSFKLLQKVNNMGFIFLITAIIFIPFLFLKSTSHDYFRSFGLLLGAGAGILFEEKVVNFSTDNLSTKNKLLRLLIGFPIIGIVYVGIGLIPGFKDINLLVVVHHLLVSLTLFGIIPLIFKQLKI